MTPLSLDVGGRPLRLLCIGAHSDDIEIGAGGTVLTLSDRPIEVTWVVLSAVGDRADEARHGAKLFAPEADVRLHDFRDGRFPMHLEEMKDVFADLGRSSDPDVIITHTSQDRHQDHRTVNELVWQTFRNHLVLGFEIPKFDGDLVTPNLYVPINDDTAARKSTYLGEAFGSQTTKPWFDDATFRGLMRIRGVECHSPSGLAEGFHVRKATLDPRR